jgi:pimeloyl-ACP methyl ester carboxylesterase
MAIANHSAPHVLHSGVVLGGTWRPRLRAGTLPRLVAAIALLLLLAASLGAWHAPLCLATWLQRGYLATLGVHGHTTMIEGASIHYLEGGEGEPVVLVHGLGGSAELDWTKLIPQLVRGGHHVFALDLPGFGDSSRPDDRSYSIPEQARVVETFLAAQHLEHVALAGDSMGGWIASTVALSPAHRVGRLILFDSPGLTFHPTFDVQLFTPRTIGEVDALLALLFPQAPAFPDFIKQDLIRETERDGWVIQRAVASMMTGADVLDRRLAELRIPTLIVWGKQDALTPLSLGEAMHRVMPQSVLEVFDGCGHISVITCTDRIGPRIVDFLGGAAPTPGRRIEFSVE